MPTEADILAALNARRIAAVFQPIVDARTYRPVHYECLMRIVGQSGQLEAPTPWIASAEALGLVHLLDRRMLENAARALIGRGDLHLAINVSARTVTRPAAANDYLKALHMLGPAASRLTVELTETAAVEDATLAEHFAARVRTLGCGFAVDDFGAGHSSIQSLLDLKPDVLKIDGSFSAGINGDDRARNIVRILADLAQTFGMTTVAERVETAEEAAVLTGLGIDRLQGYYFGRPEALPARMAA